MIGELQRPFLSGPEDGDDGEVDPADPGYFPGSRDDDETDGDDEDEASEEEQ